MVKVEDLENNFQLAWKAIQTASSKDKLRKFSEHEKYFEPYQRNATTEPVTEIEKKTADPFEKLARQLIKAKAWSVEILPSQSKIFIGDSGVTVFDCQYKFSGEEDFEDVVHELPLWDKEGSLLKKYAEAIKRVEERNIKNEDWEKPSPGNIIDFEYLAEFAFERTGTRKLGVLKMDVDNLGKLFEGISKGEDAKKLSKGLKRFFGDDLKALLNEYFPSIQPCSTEEKPKDSEMVQFKHNIYPVFAGGDDCFFIGSWDAIFHFAYQIHEAFKAFSEKKKEILGRHITLSAGLVVVGPKFPVSRFAKLAEEALNQAKTAKAKIPSAFSDIYWIGKLFRASARQLVNWHKSFCKKEKTELY